jgi:hypothetical protein
MPVPAEPEHHLRRLVAGEVVPHQQHPQRWELLGQGEAQRQALLPRLPPSPRRRRVARLRSGRQRRHDRRQGFLQPAVQDHVRAAGGRLDAHLPRRRMEQGQDLEGPPAHVLMRPRRGLALWPPTAAGMGDGLEGPGLVLAPDRQPRPGIELVGPLDQLFFATASPSLTATGPPCLPLRMTTPVEHQVRRCCQLKPAAWSVCQMV